MSRKSPVLEGPNRTTPYFTLEDLGGRPSSLGLDDAPRADGVVSRGEVSGQRPHRKPSSHVGLDRSALAEFKATAEWIWRVSEVVKVNLPSHGRGRPRQHGIADVMLYLALAKELGSVVETHRFFQNRRRWEELRTVVAEAWPDDLNRRLHERPPTRYQFMYVRKNYMQDPWIIDQIAELNRTASIQQALVMGLFDPSLGKEFEPHRTQMAVSDGTWELAMTNAGPEPVLDPRTGKAIVRRHDPDAYTYRDGSKPRGNMLVFLAAPGVRQRTGVILDCAYTKGNTEQDSDVAVDMALRAKASLGGLRGLAHDKAATAKHREALMEGGVVLINGLPRLKGGKVRRHMIGECEFTSRAGGSTSLPIWAIDGHPCTEMHDGDRSVWMKLVRGKHHPRRRKKSSTTVLYAEWALPEHPIVPRRLRGAKTMLRHTSTPVQRDADQLVTRNLQLISPHDPCYDDLYGTREFTESINHHYKQTFIHQRARSIGLTNRLLDALGYQASFNHESLLMWRKHTGGDISQWFGRHTPT